MRVGAKNILYTLMRKREIATCFPLFSGVFSENDLIFADFALT